MRGRPRLWFVLALLACAAGGVPPRGETPVNWRGAPSSVEGEAGVSISAEAWRSFMPSVAPGSTGMIVVVRVTGRSLPPGVSIDSLVLVRGAEEWSGQARAESANDSMASSIEFVSRNGPEWPTGTTMDVIARIRIPGRDRVVLRAAGVRIERVD